MLMWIGLQWLIVTALLMLLGTTQVIYGIRRGSPGWFAVGFLLMTLPVLRLVVVWNIARSHTGPVYGSPWTSERSRNSYGGSSDGSDSVSTTPPPPPLRRRTLGRDGWLGRYDNEHGLSVNVTIAPAGSPRQAEAAAPFAGAAAAKAGLVGIIVLENRTPNAVTLDTTGAVLHLADGSQVFAPNPARVIDSAGAEQQQNLVGYRPPYHIPSGNRLNRGVLFLPADTDLSGLDHIRVTLNGAWVDVR
jgi:hypothetical protein